MARHQRMLQRQRNTPLDQRVVDANGPQCRRQLQLEQQAVQQVRERHVRRLAHRAQQRLVARPRHRAEPARLRQHQHARGVAVRDAGERGHDVRHPVAEAVQRGHGGLPQARGPGRQLAVRQRRAVGHRPLHARQRVEVQGHRLFREQAGERMGASANAVLMAWSRPRTAVAASRGTAQREEVRVVHDGHRRGAHTAMRAHALISSTGVPPAVHSP